MTVRVHGGREKNRAMEERRRGGSGGVDDGQWRSLDRNEG
eukprot:SAG11_NODE_26034_length_350_cov_1.637450_1_plen_39_part_01